MENEYDERSCLFCHRSENAVLAKDAISIICSNCVQRLITASKEQLEKLQKILLEKGREEEAEYINNILLNIERKDDGLAKGKVRRRLYRGTRPDRNVRDNKINLKSFNPRVRIPLH